MKNDTTIEHSRLIVAELTTGLAAVSDRAVALATERRRLAFASATGDAKAKTKLEKLNLDSAAVLIENENVHAALEEARHRLASAEAAAALAERKAAAERLRAEVKEIAARIETRGPAIADALATIRESFMALTDDMRKARDLGCEIAPAKLVELNFAEAVSSALRPAGLALLDLAPPHRRHSPEALTSRYADRAAAWADTVLAGEREAA